MSVMPTVCRWCGARPTKFWRTLKEYERIFGCDTRFWHQGTNYYAGTCDYHDPNRNPSDPTISQSLYELLSEEELLLLEVMDT